LQLGQQLLLLLLLLLRGVRMQVVWDFLRLRDGTKLLWW
jgi:hypothetical protein